jgi:hypothetical protein
MGAASIRRAASFRPHHLVIPDCLQNGGQHPSGSARLPTEAVQHELRDRGVSDHVGPAEHLQVPGYGGLGQVEHGLKVGYKERRRRQTVQNPEPGRLGDGE